MRNFNFNWMKNAAKNTQTTGGGTSRRCEDANQSRIASDPIPCRYRVDTVSLVSRESDLRIIRGISGRLMKYAAMIFAVLILSIGQAWGDTTYYLQGISGSSGTSSLTSDFYTTASCNQSVSVSYGGVSYSKAVKFDGNLSWPAGSSGFNYPEKMIRYDCKTTSTEFTIVAYANSNSKHMSIGDIKQAALGSANTVSSATTVTLNNGSITTQTYTINSSTRASLYVGVDANSNAFIVQIIATEKGTAHPTPGNIGYIANFNKTRLVVRSGNETQLDNNTFLFKPNENQDAGYRTYFKMQTKGTHYIKFTTGAYPSKVTVNVSSSSTYYIGTSSSATTNSATASQTVELAKSTTYYINPNGSNVQVTGIKFEAIPYLVSHSLTNVTKTSGSTGAGAAQSGSNYDAVFAAADGYDLPDDITVTIGGAAATAGTDYTWNSSTGAFQVPAAKVTGAIVVTIAGEAAPAGSGWGIASSDNSWTASTDEMSGSGTVTKTLSLSANADLQFKIVDISGNTWYGNGEIWGGTKTQSVSSTGTENNCHLLTTEAGSYTFSFNTSTKDLTITYPNSYTFYYANSSSWSNVYVYKFTSNGSTGNNATWPGVKIATPSYTCGGTDYYAATSDGYAKLIFTDNSSQTGDMVVAAADDGKYVGGTGSSWSNFPTYTISYAANSGSGSMSSQTGIACGTDKATTANSFTAPSGYQFAGWKANVDVTVGGSTQTAGTVLADGVTIQNVSSNITLTAQWEVIPTYDVIYNTNGGTGGSTASQTGNLSGAQVTTRANGFTRTGYKFKWWNTAANGSGEDFYPGEKVTIASANVNLYAQWEQVGSDEEFWCGSPNAFTSNKITVGDMVLTSYGNKTTINTDLTTDPTIVNKYNSSVDKHAICIAVADNDQYVQVHFSDGSPINSLKLWATTNQTSSKKLVVIYSTTADFSSGQYEAKEVSVPANNAASKALTDFSPATADKYFYARIYRKVATAVYEFTGGSGNTARIYGIKAKKGANCSTPAAPTAFTAGSISATGATFTITDAADAASYDIYYSTSSTAPEASTPATTTSTSKTKAVTGLTAATTYYAWVRSVCDASHKSAWVALNPDDDTHTFATSCVAPTTVTISATVNEDDGYWFYPGDAIELTATPTGSPAGSPVTYQWVNGGVDIVGANSSTYSVASATTADAGKYTCTISYGACSTTSAEFELKCMQFYLKNSGGSDISNHALQKVDATHATLSLSLTGGTTYKFRVTDGCGNWYGNDGEMTSSNCTDWTMKDDADCRITTSSKSATYTFNFDFTDGLLGKEMKVSVVYPAGNQAASKVIYWDNSVLNWASAPWYRIGKSTHNNKTEMELVPGTANLYAVTTTEYNGFEYWHIANNQGQGTGNIFWTKDNSEGSPDEITNAMGFEGSPVTADAVTFTPTSSHATGSSSDNDNCEFYEYGQQNGMKTDRVTISPYSNGTITVNYTDTEDEDQSFTSGYQDLAHTVILTSITAVPASGYEIDDALTINGDDYEANHVVTGATTVAASFKPATYTVTLNTNSGTINAGNVTSYTYLTGATLPTNVTRDGYRFMGWYATSNFSTDRVYTIGTSEYGNKEYWAKWAQLYTITNGSPANGTITVASSAIEGETVSISAAANTGYVFDEWNVYKTGTPATTIDPASSSASTNFTMPAYGVTVDASFVVQTYTLSYSIGTGATGAASGGTAAGSYAEDATITVPAKGTLDSTGCTFRGWTDGTTFYLAGQTFSMPASNVTLTAVWDEPVSDCKTWSGTPNSFTDGSMTVSTNLILTSGSISNPSSEDIYSGTKATCFVINGSDKYLEGHLYDGSDISSVTISAATNQSSAQKYAMVFSTSSDFSSTVTVYEHTAPSKDDARDDSKLIHEFTAPSGVKYFRVYRKFVYDKTQYGDNNTIRVYGVEVCKAGGGYANFTVSFADQTGFAGSSTLPDDIVGVPTGKKIIQPANPTATGYIFGGWYTDSGCTSAWYWGSSTVTKDTTLYAKWTEKSTPAGTTLTPTASSVCSGSSTTLTLNASTSGVEYELYEGETKLRTVTGTGSALSLGSTSNLTAAKTYTVKTVENEDYKGMTLSGATTTVTIATATSVSVASTSLAATVDESFTIDGITASGAGELSYQWYSYTSSGGAGESLIAGAESDSYTFTPDETGSYYFKCAVTGDCGTVMSDMITVTATDLFDITMGTHTNGSFTIKVGSADAVSTSTASSASATIAIVATPSSGYVFKNWEILDSSSDDITTTVGATTTSASTSFTMPSEAVTINAVFVATHSLTVSVSGGVGGSVSPTSTTVGETLTQSISATPGTGYTFGSWAVSGTDASLSSTTANPTTFTMGTANATVTATFSAKTYGITLDAGNGTGGSESVTMTYNSASHTSITAPSLTGYSLVGWYTGAGGTGTMIMNASGTLQASVDGYTDGSGNWTKDATCTLYAKYTANYPSGYLYITDVMATPEAKAGYAITMTKNSANYGTELVSAFQTDRAGYEHWAYTSGGSGDITLSFSDALPASATAGGLLIDVWWGAEDNRTTSITLNGGDAASLDAVGSSSDRNQVRKATYTTDLKSLSSVKLTCSGGKVVWFRIGIKDRPGYLLTYDDGDGSGAPSAEYKPNATITLSSTAPTRSGYIFRGWQVGGSGTVYQPGAEFSMPAEATTLVAKWEAIDFEFKAGTTKGSEPTDGTVITSSNLSTYWTAGAVLTGGTMTNTSGAILGINASYGFVYAASSNRQLTINLTGSKALGAGTVITIYGYSNNSTDACGFKISGNNMSPATYTPASNDCTAFTQTYTVTEGSALDGETSFTVDPANNIRVYLNRIILTGCAACTPIDPELTAGTTTLYLEPAATNTTLTLDKDGSTGSVDWSVSPSGVVSITGSGTEVTITAVAAGSATVKATIGADGTHCGKTVTKDFTVAACEIMEIAGATVASTTSGILTGTTAIVTELSSNKLNTNGTSMFGLVLPSSANHFQVGDSILFNLKVGDWYQGAKVSSMCVYVSAGKATSKLNIYTSASIASGTSTTIRFAVTQAMIDAGLVDSVIVFRDGTTTQNHVMSSVSVKRYACSDGLAKFTGDGSDSDWNNEDNWANGKVPTIDDRAIVEKPIVVNIAHAVAKEVILYQNSTNTGSLSIQANKGLEVAGKVQVWNGSALSATTSSDLLLESSSAGNATLIFDNSNSDQATVQMYSKGWTTGEQGGGTWNWQTVGVPVTDATRMNDYYGGYMYEWSSGWVDKTDMYGALTPFTAYSVSYPTGDAEHLHTYSIDGTLVPTGDKSISIPANTSVMALANSWTAPIHISDIEFTSEPANIFLYNTGYNYESAATKADSRYAPGTYLCIPKNSAPYLDESYIAPMQGFYVKNKLSSAGTITINYNTVVRPSSDRAIVSGAMHAPKRTMSNLSEPAVLKMYVSDSQHDDRLVLLEREDFSRGFDNGWDGEKFQINAVKTAPRIFAINETGGKESVSAIPELENTVIGFRPGKEETYTIRFEYNGDETLYLRDTRTGAETLITNESEYVFLSDGTNEDARFIIVRVQSTPTGTEEIGAGSKAYKLMIEDHIYIIRDGRMYSVDGALVNLERK